MFVVIVVIVAVWLFLIMMRLILIVVVVVPPLVVIMGMDVFMMVVGMSRLKAMVSLSVAMHVGVLGPEVLRLMHSVRAVGWLRNVFVMLTSVVVVVHIVITLAVILNIVRSMSLVQIVMLLDFFLFCMEHRVVSVLMVFELFHPTSRFGVVLGVVWLVNWVRRHVTIAMFLHMLIAMPQVLSLNWMVCVLMMVIMRIPRSVDNRVFMIDRMVGSCLVTMTRLLSGRS